MAHRKIRIDPMKDKAEYDITLEDGVDDVEWIAPDGATSIEVFYIGTPTALGQGSAAKSKVFNPTPANTQARAKPARDGKGREIECEIVVTYPSGKLHIDPFVKILP